MLIATAQEYHVGTPAVELASSEDLTAYIEDSKRGGKMSSLWNAVNNITRPIAMGFASAFPELTQPSALGTDTNRRILSIDQLASVWTLESQLTWLVPDLLAEGSVNLLSSASGTGKTWFAYFLAGSVAHGRPVFGQDVSQRRVLYLDGENPAYVVKQRLHDLGIPETAELKIWGGWEIEPPPGPENALIIDFARRERPLLIWDSLVEFHTGDEQSSTETRKFMRGFRQLANLGATALILHHTGKAESAQKYRGSSDIEAAVDMAFVLEANDNRAILNDLTLTPFKSRLAPMPTRWLRYRPGSGFDGMIVASPSNSRLDPLEIVTTIVQAAPGLNQSEIVKKAMEAGIGKHAAEDALKREGTFSTKRGKGKELRYWPVGKSAPAEPTEEIIEAVPEPQPVP